jgi:hypothetical protein
MSNRVPLCQATLSIGLYLLLEGPGPTKHLVPGEAQDKPPNVHAKLSLLRATRIVSNSLGCLR